MELTEKQIRFGFWYYHDETDFPPPSITNVEDYHPAERLNLAITQLNWNSKLQKQLIEKWCEKLPKLAEVKFLWFHSRVTQQMFDTACQMPNLEALFIKWSGIKDISKIRLASKLMHLHIGSSPQIESIEPLINIKSIISLDLENFKKHRDFSTLSTLSNLQGLGVDGSMYTTQMIETLKPFGKLNKLRYLSLTNSRVLDKSLDPLLNLKELVMFRSSWNYPDSEFLKLKSLPKFKYGNTEEALFEYKKQKKHISDLVKKASGKKV